MQLFKNLGSNLGDTFRRWKDTNQMSKLQQRVMAHKGSVLTVLETLLNSGKKGLIREAINKFRQNRRIVEIQRNFLKRLLTSKAGMVVIAFKKIQSLPELKDM